VAFLDLQRSESRMNKVNSRQRWMGVIAVQKFYKSEEQLAWQGVGIINVTTGQKGESCGITGGWSERERFW